MAYRFEREVALEDGLSDLGEDGAFDIGQVHPPDARVSHAVLVLFLGLLSLMPQHRQELLQKGATMVAVPGVQHTLCRASSSSLLFLSSCLLTALGCSSRERLVDEWAFRYSSCLWVFSARAFRRLTSASCWNRTETDNVKLFLFVIFFPSSFLCMVIHQSAIHHFFLLLLPLLLEVFPQFVQFILTAQERLTKG